MAIKKIMRRDVIRGVPERFKKQYGRYDPNRPLPWVKDGRTKAEIFQELDALDLETCTPDEIDRVVCSKWSSNACDECGEENDVLISIGDEPDHEARWVDVCAKCLNVAVALAVDPPA